jgi:hypothetical protein
MKFIPFFDFLNPNIKAINLENVYILNLSKLYEER